MAADRPLAGRVAVITGASSGIGAATARRLAAAGMTVVCGARRADRLAMVCDEIRAVGGVAAAIPTDLRSEEAVTALVDAAPARYGRLDALVNVAGMGTVRLLEDGRMDEWRATFETNVLGTFAACRAALRHLLPQGRGDIVNMTSVSAEEAWPYMSAYAASKAAVHTLSQSLRREVASRGIRVMTIAVHNVATEFATNFDPEILPAAARRWEELGLLNRDAGLLDPTDVGAAVAFMLAQPDPFSVHAIEIRARAN